MVEKIYIEAQDLLEDGFRLGARVLADGFEPSFMIAIWRGGVPMGIAVQELLDYCGVACDHIAIRTSSYSGIDGRARGVRVHGLNYLVKKLTHEDRLLIVDDVYDTGLTIQAVLAELRARTRLNMPSEVKIAVPWYKPSRNQTGRVPDYYLHETDRWLKFPHSVEGLSEDEIRANRPALYEILQQAGTRPSD